MNLGSRNSVKVHMVHSIPPKLVATYINEFVTSGCIVLVLLFWILLNMLKKEIGSNHFDSTLKESRS